MEWIFKPWPWYVGGPLIALTLFLLLYFGKNFGMSSNLKTLCTICGAGKNTDFFKFDWKTQQWNLFVSVGTVIGGWIAYNYLTKDSSVLIHNDTIAKLNQLNIKSAGTTYQPKEL